MREQEEAGQRGHQSPQDGCDDCDDCDDCDGDDGRDAGRGRQLARHRGGRSGSYRRRRSSPFCEENG